MELRHLRYFVAVAEELNFTRAAKRLGINQPPLSLQIRQLEKELGTPLFIRRTRGVELTNAGKLMLEEARVILKEVETAKAGVQRSARGETGRIVIGFSGGTYFHPLIPAIIREYRTDYPDVILFPQVSGTAFLTVQLLAGQIDIAFVRLPIDDGDGLAIEPLVDEPTVMVVPAMHPLGRAASAPLRAFAGDSFVLYPRAINPRVYDFGRGRVQSGGVHSGARPGGSADLGCHSVGGGRFGRINRAAIHEFNSDGRSQVLGHRRRGAAGENLPGVSPR